MNLNYRRSAFASTLLFAATIMLPPAAAVADRGALTLEAGGFGSMSSLPPSVGTGSRVTGTSLGGILGLRYAPTGWLELSVGGFYEAPASYFHAGTVVSNDNGDFAGTLEGRVSSWGLTAGARYVHGLVWRYFLGLEAGFARQTAEQLDLIDVTDPANPRSFGLGLADQTTTALLLVPVAGLEWVASDHITVGLSSRLQLHLGEHSTVELLVPLTFSYSWYVL